MHSCAEKMKFNCSERKCYNLMRAKRAGKIKIELSQAKRADFYFFRKICTFPPNSSNLRSDSFFSFQKRTDYLFPAFSRSEYLFPKSARPSPPPPHQNQMVVPLAMDRNRGKLKLNSLYPRFPVKAQLILSRLHVEYLYNIPL